ncbi:MAG: ROK family protein [Acidobacteria bacterium]|nr:ROK family protein [Acidobacteriota bacterium]
MKTRTSQPQPAKSVIGVEFNRAHITAALIDERGQMLARRQNETPQRTTRAVALEMTRLILNVASTKERGNSLITAIGVSVPGLVDPTTRRISISGLKGWTRVDLRRMLEEGLSNLGHDIRIPTNERRARAQLSISSQPTIAIQSHISCAAAAESWSGAARGKNNVVFASFGEEIEVGILADGRVLQGSSGLAGLAGWLSLSESNKPGYEVRGCLATEATIASLTRRAIEEWSDSSTSMLGKIIKADPMQLDAETIIRAARGGDPLALKVVNETCRWIGRGIANLISILNPDAVVIGGELGLSLRPFYDVVREEAGRWTSAEVFRSCRIVSASLGDEARLLGAARLALLK